MIFLLSIRFLDDRYHGLSDNGEQPEWPPSPFRVFQAIVAGNARGLEIPEPVVAALKWLEALDPPDIVAPVASDGQPLRTYVLNNVSDSDPNSRAAKMIRPTLLSGDRHVEYAWSFSPSEASDRHVKILIAAARHLQAVGWGIDLAIGHGQEIGMLADPLGGRYRYRPSHLLAGGVKLRVPQTGSFVSLCRAHGDFLARYELSGVTRQESAPVVYGTRQYTVGAARSFVAFRLVDENDEDVGYRTDNIKEIAGRLRRIAADACKGHIDEAIINGMIMGHPKDGPRLSILPLPSIGHQHVDGRIRRVILAEPLGSDGMLCEHLRRALDQQPLDFDGDCPCLPSRLVALPRRDSVLARYTATAKTWASVTPVLLPGHNERRQDDRTKSLARACRLINKSLQQAGITTSAEFAVDRIPYWPGSRHAREYDPREKLGHCPRYHLEITFQKPVTGPLSIGAGRHVGFGTLAACPKGN